ncbi:MAG: PilZ domain-containing protein [Geobacteraceae bacterium]|nr:PilZ domain-containing protein [Geobacteraceae bacterium]
MQKHFQLITVDDIRKDEDSILEALSTARNDIKLLNYYKELPVSFDASLKQNDNGVVEIHVHELQAAAMMIEKEVFIKCESLPHDVIAKVLKIRKNSGSAILANFHYVIITAERRVCVRVRVSEKYDATFRYNNRLVHGLIEDISFSGLSINAPKGITLEENSKGMVSIALSSTRLDLSGKLIKVNQGDSSTKFIIELEVDKKSERHISQFIFAQQSKIIRELKELYSTGPDTILL